MVNESAPSLPPSIQAASGGLLTPANSPSPNDDEVSLSDVATAVLAVGQFGFGFEWEDAGFGDTGEPLTSEGAVDVERGLARYRPILDETGSGEVRILGEDMYVGSDDAGWEGTVRAPGQPTWLELMPLSGNPIQVLERLQDAKVAGTPTEVPGQGENVCRRYAETTPEGAPHHYVACHRDGVLRWIQYPATEDEGPVTLTFDAFGDDVVVERPTEGLTEMPTAPRSW